MLRTLCAILIMTALAAAQDIVVTPGGSIQTAINLVASGGRVLVEPGTYVEQIDFLGKAIEVIGVNGPLLTTINANGAAPVVRFNASEGPASKLRGFTITGGAATFGTGGIAASTGATPTIEDCIIRNNTGKFGGGVSGSPSLRRCAILNNNASVSHGGGFYGAPQLKFCVVAGNTCTSGSGGGGYLLGGTSLIEDSVFVENRSVLTGGKGGGLYIKSSAAATIRRSVFVANYTAAGNFNALGGAIAVEAAGTLVENCTLIGNLLNGNTKLGGAIWGPATVRNSIARDNTAPQVSGIALATYSDIQGGLAGLGNFDADPQFVSPVDRDYHLTLTSPGIDVGDPALIDPDGSVSDVGVFPFQSLYTRSNTRPSDWTAPSWPELSSMIGGRTVLRILAGAGEANQTYITLGTLSGTAPGVSVATVPVPLNPDFYTTYTLMTPNVGLLTNSLGVLDGGGAAQTILTLPSNPQGFPSSITAHHAALVVAPPLLRFVTNAEPLVIVP